MKVPFIICFLFSGLICQAQPDTTLYKVCYETPSGRPFNRTFIISDTAQMFRSEYLEEWNYNDSSWQPYRQIVYQYDSLSDNIAIQFLYTNINNAWYTISAEYYSYDSLHRRIGSYYYSGTSMDTLNYFTNHYDVNNNLDTTSLYRKNNQVWTLETYTTYHYNNNLLDSAYTTAVDTAYARDSFQKFYYTQLEEDSLQYNFSLNPSGAYDSLYRKFFIYDYLNNSDTIRAQSYIMNDWDCYSTDYYENKDSFERISSYYSTCCGCGYSSADYTYIGSTDSLLHVNSCSFSHGGNGECLSCDYLYQPFITAINSTPDKTALSIFPNPAYDQLSIRSAEKILSLQMYDLTGNLKMVEMTNDYLAELHTQKFQEGIYILQIHSGAGILYRKVIIAH